MKQPGMEKRGQSENTVVQFFRDKHDEYGLFCRLLSFALNQGSGGGGSQSDLPWRDKNDDDLLWARKCARAASRILGKKPRTGIKR